MIKEIKKEVTELQKYCDICFEKSVEEKEVITKCEICCRHLCGKHTIPDYTISDDYPNNYCQQCWNAGSEIRNQISLLNIETDDKVEKLNEQWIENAKKLLK